MTSQTGYRTGYRTAIKINQPLHEQNPSSETLDLFFVSTHFSPMSHFYTPQVFWCSQGLQKCDIGLKWVKTVHWSSWTILQENQYLERITVLYSSMSSFPLRSCTTCFGLYSILCEMLLLRFCQRIVKWYLNLTHRLYKHIFPTLPSYLGA